MRVSRYPAAGEYRPGHTCRHSPSARSCKHKVGDGRRRNLRKLQDERAHLRLRKPQPRAAQFRVFLLFLFLKNSGSAETPCIFARPSEQLLAPRGIRERNARKVPPCKVARRALAGRRRGATSEAPIRAINSRERITHRARGIIPGSPVPAKFREMVSIR